MKTVIITGGTGTIGRELIKEFSKNSEVIFTFNSREKDAEILAKKYNATALKCDLTSYESISNFWDKVNKIKSVDILINNAGISEIGLFTEMNSEMIERIISINLTGAMYMSQFALGSMIRKKSGDIINISSVWGVHGASCEAAYSAAKAGLIGFTKALSKEVGPSGIKVNCIAPGVIEGEMNDWLNDDEKNELIENTPLMKLGKAADIAHTARFITENGFITGQTIGIDGGFY